MKTTSLRRRFFINSAVVVIAVMVLSALLINVSYQHELTKTQQEKLKLHIFNLLSVSHYQNTEITLPIILSNPEFNTPESDFWAAVLDDHENIIWKSLSIDALPSSFSAAPKLGEWSYGEMSFSGASFFTASYTVQWGLSDNNETKATPKYRFMVAQKTQMFDQSLQRFRLWLTVGFILFTLSLLSIQFFVLKFSFKPINMLGDEIKRLENGDQNKLLAHYPKELASVTSNLNMLIDKEYKQREKYRAAMADLAHSLKTPISVINAEVSKQADNSTLNNALTRINTTIEYQLRRAVISGHNLLTKGSNIASTLDMVLSALDKIYQDRALSIVKNMDPNSQFMGDENDLLEIFGNLLDNAYKHASTTIHISCLESEDSLTICVEDDGQGVPKEKAQDIFKRGTRLDETVQGQGIGLSILQNIVSSYDGQLALSESKLGGALFTVRFFMKRKNN